MRSLSLLEFVDYVTIILSQLYEVRRVEKLKPERRLEQEFSCNLSETTA